MKWRTATVAVIVGLLVLMVAGPAVAQGTGTPVVGTEKLGWDQDAATTADLALLSWAAYIDQATTPVPIANAVCGQTKGTDGFPCTGNIPALTPGDHTITMVAVMMVGTTRLESLKATPLPVRLVIAPPAPTGTKIIRGSPGD